MTALYLFILIDYQTFCLSWLRQHKTVCQVYMPKKALLYQELANRFVQCHLCAHYCVIPPGGFGLCGVRQNVEGILYSLVYSEAAACNIDPIEKKPLYHFLPGSYSLSLSTIGCNFRCSFCQNWQISQASKKDNHNISFYKLSPRQIVQQAVTGGCRSIAYTYTEPTIYFEYAYDTARLAKQEGLYNVFVTNGYMDRQALEMVGSYLDAANVDLKSFSDEFYQKYCQARLKPVIDTIRLIKEMGIWLEVTTLLIPGLNDSDQDLNSIAEFLAVLDKNIPWHINRFYPCYKLANYPSTPLRIIKKAERIARKNGLQFVYLGNIPGESNTYCACCGRILIERKGFDVLNNVILDGKCPCCLAGTAGLF